MIGILNSLTFLTLILTILVLVGRGVWQLKKINLANSFFVFVYIGLSSFLFGLVSETLDYKALDNVFIMKSSIGLVAFSLLCISAMSTIDSITSKKVKTLMRLPIIGFLLGWYLEPLHLGIAILIIELTQLALFNKYKETQRYSYRQQAKSLLGMFLAFILYYNQLWLFYFGFSLYLVMKFQIGNGVKLKLMIADKLKAEA